MLLCTCSVCICSVCVCTYVCVQYVCLSMCAFRKCVFRMCVFRMCVQVCVVSNKHSRSGFSPVCRWWRWSSTAPDPHPRSKSTLPGETGRHTQSPHPPAYRWRNSSQSTTQKAAFSQSNQNHSNYMYLYMSLHTFKYMQSIFISTLHMVKMYKHSLETEIPYLNQEVSIEFYL